MKKALILFSLSLSLALSAGGQQNGEVSSIRLPFEIGLSDRKIQSVSAQKTSKIQYLDANGQPVLVQFTSVGPPRILPISTADSYPEGTSINLICTVSGGQRQGLVMNWKFNGNEIDSRDLKPSGMFSNVEIGKVDIDISRLKITNATMKNSGQYTCNARNPLGQDTVSVKIVINVEMKWVKTPNDQVEIGIGQELALECDAVGSPQPTIEWYRLSEPGIRENLPKDTILIAKGPQMKLTRTSDRDSGLYECIAKNGLDKNLRKIIQVKVRGK